MPRLPNSTKLVLTQSLDDRQLEHAKRAYLTIMLRRKHLRRQNTLVRLSCAVLLLGIASTGIIGSNPAHNALLHVRFHYTSESMTLRWK
jgi:hypothetical protein